MWRLKKRAWITRWIDRDTFLGCSAWSQAAASAARRGPRDERRAVNSRTGKADGRQQILNMEAYCVKCKTKREMAEPEAVFTASGTPATKGREGLRHDTLSHGQDGGARRFAGAAGCAAPEEGQVGQVGQGQPGLPIQVTW